MKGSSRTRLSGAMLLTARSLALDLLTVEVVDALAARGVPSIVLKGSSFARWLYEDGALRAYGDGDVLVPPEGVPVAHATLRDLGFRYAFESEEPTESLIGLGWWRGEHEQIDLHATIAGMTASPEVVWQILSDRTQTASIGGRTVTILNEPARALHVALHATNHGEGMPLEDLERALSRLPLDAWREAAGLAADLGAMPAFVTGLRLLPEGRELAEVLKLNAAADPMTTLRASAPPPLAVGIEDMWSTPGLASKVRRVLRELFPSRTFMRVWRPRARTGRAAMVASYPARWLYLGRRFPAAFAAWRRARRTQRET